MLVQSHMCTLIILSKILLAGPHDLLSSADGAELRWACGWMSHLFQVTSSC